jgi:hypothetical protein
MSYSMHFCGEEFQRINLFAEAKTCCPSQEPMPGCCDDVSNLELPNTDQQISDVLDFQPSAFEVICPELGNYSVPVSEIALELTLGFADSSPPLVLNTPLFLLHCIFLI